MISRKLHATLVAYLALFVAIGGALFATTANVVLPTAALSAKVTHVHHVASHQLLPHNLPAGDSESGTFSAGGSDGVGGYIGYGISYQEPILAAIPDSHIIDVWSKTAVHCPGPGKAAPGYLCLYDSIHDDVDHGYGYSNDSGYFSKPSPGVVLYWHVTGSDSYVGGEWTVTAA